MRESVRFASRAPPAKWLHARYAAQVTPPSRLSGWDGGGLGQRPRARRRRGRGPWGDSARTVGGGGRAGGGAEGAQGRQSPEGERVGRPAAVRASERKSAGARTRGQKGETAAAR